MAQYVNSHVQLPNLQVSTRVIGGSLNTTNIAISNTNTSSNMITTTSYQQQHSVDEQRNRLVSRVAVGSQQQAFTPQAKAGNLISAA